VLIPVQDDREFAQAAGLYIQDTASPHAFSPTIASGCILLGCRRSSSTALVEQAVMPSRDYCSNLIPFLAFTETPMRHHLIEMA